MLVGQIAIEAFTKHRNQRPVISMEEMIDKVPAIAAHSPHEKMSERYSFLPTQRVVEDIMSLGWNPVSISGVRNKTEYGRHLIRFQPSDDVFEALAPIGAVPDLVLVNSHDGTSAFKAMCGIYRLACANGLIISEKSFDAVTIRHLNYTIEDTMRMIHGFTQKLPKVIESIDNLRKVQTTLEMRYDFLHKAYTLREEQPDKSAMSMYQSALDQLGTPRRKEDQEQNLWNLYNIAQEKILNGRYYRIVNKDGKFRSVRARAITSVPETVRLNTALNELAESYL